MSSRSVFILVGPKGSGKTHTGKVLEDALGIAFLRVEPLVRDFNESSHLTGDELERAGFHVEEQAIDNILATETAVLYEATGSSDYFPEVLKRLRAKYRVVLIRLRCPLETCFHRVETRDPTDQIPVSPDRVKEINEKADAVEYDWDLEIDNSDDASVETLVSLFRQVEKRIR